eukprot:Sspe_Gene.42557::Locus_20671_Transcript_1_1_Confidence_1.000_Length_2233::g.42557::m.42557
MLRREWEAPPRLRPPDPPPHGLGTWRNPMTSAHFPTLSDRSNPLERAEEANHLFQKYISSDAAQPLLVPRSLWGVADEPSTGPPVAQERGDGFVSRSFFSQVDNIIQNLAPPPPPPCFDRAERYAASPVTLQDAVMDLRRQLDEERAHRERLTQQIASLGGGRPAVEQPALTALPKTVKELIDDEIAELAGARLRRLEQGMDEMLERIKRKKQRHRSSSDESSSSSGRERRRRSRSRRSRGCSCDNTGLSVKDLLQLLVVKTATPPPQPQPQPPSADHTRLQSLELQMQALLHDKHLVQTRAADAERREADWQARWLDSRLAANEALLAKGDRGRPGVRKDGVRKEVVSRREMGPSAVGGPEEDAMLHTLDEYEASIDPLKGPRVTLDDLERTVAEMSHAKYQREWDEAKLQAREGGVGDALNRRLAQHKEEEVSQLQLLKERQHQLEREVALAKEKEREQTQRLEALAAERARAERQQQAEQLRQLRAEEERLQKLEEAREEALVEERLAQARREVKLQHQLEEERRQRLDRDHRTREGGPMLDTVIGDGARQVWGESVITEKETTEGDQQHGRKLELERELEDLDLERQLRRERQEQLEREQREEQEQRERQLEEERRRQERERQEQLERDRRQQEERERRERLERERQELQERER